MVKLETMASTKSIPCSESRTDFPVLVQVTAPMQPTQRHSLDLVAVLDTSGSMMTDHRLGFVKEAMKFVIDNLGDDDRLSIQPFRNTGNEHRLCPLTKMSEKNRKELKTKVTKLRAPDGADDDLEAAKEAAQVSIPLALSYTVIFKFCNFFVWNRRIFRLPSDYTRSLVVFLTTK